MGNDMHQAATSENFHALGYGAEGCERRTEEQMQLFVINNTFVNEAHSGQFVSNFAGGDVLVANNLVFGRGRLLSGDGTDINNIRLPLSDRVGSTWNPPASPRVLDKSIELPAPDGVWLYPLEEFEAPLGTRKREVQGALDIGSREKSGLN